MMMRLVSGFLTETPDDVRVTDDDLVTVLLLTGRSSVEVLPEGGLYPRPVRHVEGLRLPGVHLGLGLDGSPLSQYPVSGQDLDLGQVLGDQPGGLHGPGHVGVDEVSVGQGELRQPGPRPVRLGPAQAGEAPLLVGGAGHVVLAVSDQDQVSAGPAPLALPAVPVVVPPHNT